MSANTSYASLLGWVPGDFGCESFDDRLVAAVRAAQARLGVTIDGICGRQTYGALLAERERTLLANTTQTTDRLRDAGEIAAIEAKRIWLRDIVDLPPSGTASYEPARVEIDTMIRTAAGLDWDWEAPYARNFEWCGAFASTAWRAAGLKLAQRKSFFASTYRLDRWARYQPFETTANPKPGLSPFRKLIELDEHSGPRDALFSDDDPPRAGDILLCGGVNTAYGRHVTLVESYDVVSGVFTTLEGNATGAGPSGGTRHGVIRGRRPVGLRRGEGATTYHARRLLRPGVADCDS